MCAFEHLLEHAPAIDTLGTTDPDVRSVFAAPDFQAESFTGFFEKLGVGHVVLHQFRNFGFSSLGVDGLGSTLNGIGCSVELGGMTTSPELLERDPLSGSSCTGDRFGNHGVGTTHAGKSTVLGEGAKLNRAVLGSFDFINRTRN